MNKKTNTAIFLIGATVLNIVLIFALFFLCITLGSIIFDLNNAEGSTGLIVLGASFVISIGGSIFIYSKVIKWAAEKFHFEDKIVPLFGRKTNRRK